MNIEIIRMINSFKNDITKILGDKIIDIIIHGSTVNGGFIYGKGDIDFIVFINDILTDNEVESIYNYHRKVREEDSLKSQLEGCYYCLDASNKVIGGIYLGTKERGWKEIHGIVHNKIGQAEIINGYHSTNNSKIVSKVFSYTWLDVEKELKEQSKLLLSQVSEINDLGFKIYSIYVSCRSLYTIYNKAFISKRDSINWILNNENYIKYKSLLNECYKHRNPLSEEDTEKIDEDKFTNLENFLIQIDKDIQSVSI